MADRCIRLDNLLMGLADCGGHAGIEIAGLALDSRQLSAGDAFVALAGESGHGMDFVDQAEAAGAVAVLHDGKRAEPAECRLPAIAVPDLSARLPALAGRMWSDPASDMDLLAVTGTNGKTSVAWLLAQALDGAMIGTLGAGRPGALLAGSHTTPDLLSIYRTLAELRRQGISTVVMEASSHALQQQRLAGLSFTSVIFTMLGHDHLDYHDNLSAYGEAKALLFTEFSSRRQLINLDDAFGARLAGQLAASGGLIGYSLAGHPDSRAGARLFRAGPNGIAAEVALGNRKFEIQSSLLGRINLWNLLIVAAELHARGLPPERIQRTIAALEPVPGRMQPVSGSAGRLAVVDYAHTPDALQAVLASVRELASNELWCVFGCGGDRDRTKRPRMGRIAESLADHVILTDDNPRNEDGTAIIRAIQAGMERPQRSLVIRDRAHAIRHAITASGAGDVVLVAGKGHEREQVIGDQRLPMDDALIARQALEVAA